MKRSTFSASIALFAALASPAAHAEESVYLGDCARARIVQQQNTIDNLVSRKKYEGTQRAVFSEVKTAICNKNSFLMYTLTERSRTKQSVIFDLVRRDIQYGTENGCPALSLSGNIYSVTVTFTTKFEQNGDQCDYFVWAHWDQENKVSGWKGSFANRIVTLGGEAFVVKQPASNDGQFWTPLAFTGVNP